MGKRYCSETNVVINQGCGHTMIRAAREGGVNSCLTILYKKSFMFFMTACSKRLHPISPKVRKLEGS